MGGGGNMGKFCGGGKSKETREKIKKRIIRKGKESEKGGRGGEMRKNL